MSDCTNCGTTLAECNVMIRSHGHGCCASCFLNDTHLLLGPSTEIPIRQRIEALEDFAQDVTEALERVQAEIDDLRADVTSLSVVEHVLGLLLGSEALDPDKLGMDDAQHPAG
jgi:hypothetical protein